MSDNGKTQRKIDAVKVMTNIDERVTAEEIGTIVKQTVESVKRNEPNK